MMTANLLTIVLLLILPGASGAQTSRPAESQPEVFAGTAQAKNADGAISGNIEVRLRRVTPQFDKTAVETALKEGGYPRFLIALKNAPEVGQLVLGASAPFSVRYARERSDANGRTLLLVTDKPVYFVGGGRTEAPLRKGYEVAVIEITIDGQGTASGSMAAAARVRPDGDGGVLLDDFAEQLITITNLTRKPL
jgi:hypothetical protein